MQRWAIYYNKICIYLHLKYIKNLKATYQKSKSISKIQNIYINTKRKWLLAYAKH